MTLYKPGDNNLDRILYRDIPSQLPVHATRESYKRMLEHCHEEGAGYKNVWRCSRTGAKVKAKMVRRRIFDGDVYLETAPVVELFCSVCDTEPGTDYLKATPVQSAALQTISM